MRALPDMMPFRDFVDFLGFPEIRQLEEDLADGPLEEVVNYRDIAAALSATFALSGCRKS
jgi:hypothetical protein